MPIISQQDFVDAKRDIKDIGESVNLEKIIKPRWGAAFKSLPLVSKGWQNKLNEFQEAINIAAAAGAGANGWTDLLVKTWSGRTQAEKNKDAVSAQDYGAKGDGLTDDTQAFTDLELNYTGRIVDLQNIVYLVDKPPTENIYINGSWLIDGDSVPSNGELFTNKAKIFDVNLSSKDSSVSLYKMLIAGGRGGARTLQSIAQDGYGNLYSNHNTQVDGNLTTVSIINKYSENSPIISNFTDFMLPEDRLGHQGLSILHVKENQLPFLITASPEVGAGTQNHPDFDYSVGNPYGIVKFRFKSNTEGEIEKPIQFRVLQPSISSTSSTTPTITTDGKWLIIKYSSEGQSSNHTFRVFDTKLLNSNVDKDISLKYTHEFTVNVGNYLDAGDSIHSLSGFCSDGNHLYAILAGWREPTSQPKYLLSCDLLGNNVEVSKGDMFEKSVESVSGVSPTFIETEGLSILNIEGSLNLACIVISNTPSHTTTIRRFAGLYLMGSKTERLNTNSSSLNLYDNSLTPDSPVTIKRTNPIVNGVSQKSSLVINNNGAGTGNILTLQRNGEVALNVYASTANIGITSTSGTQDLNFGATKNNGVDQNSSWNWVITVNGNFVPYLDNTYNIGQPTKRPAKIFGKAINLKDLLIFENNASAKTGGLVTGDLYRNSYGDLKIVI